LREIEQGILNLDGGNSLQAAERFESFDYQL